MTVLNSKKSLFLFIYLTTFLYSFHFALPLFIESSFIAQFYSVEHVVGYIFSFAAIFTVILTFLLPHILRRFGNYRATLSVMGAEIFTLLTLVFASNPIVILVSFVMHQVLASVIFLNLDYFVENFTINEKTGSTRGVFMTIYNIAIAAAPFLAGLMITDHDFWKIYAAAAVFMIFGFFVIAKFFKDYEDPLYVLPSFKTTFSIVKNNCNLYSIILMHFLLTFFYVWMTIYTPIYLNIHMGIQMSDILSIIIPISLLPFIFFQIKLGSLADNKFGEKELLIIGFIIMGISTAGMSWINSASLIVWSGILFMTRIGATAVETMTESYFYKQVGPGDAHLITFMRTVRASAYVIGPIIGSIILLFIDFRYLFLILGVIMFLAIPHALYLKDSR